jgi:hypothetical protein
MPLQTSCEVAFSREKSHSAAMVSRYSNFGTAAKTPRDESSSHLLWCSPRNFFGFLGGFHGVFVSLCAQFTCGFVIAPVVRCRGRCVSVGGVDVQVRSIVLIGLEHSYPHIPALFSP